MKKLFYGIDLSWKKLILYAVISALYTAIMAILPFTYETSLRDIAIQFEWWILIGILIISNSKSPKDSALKCFVFFLISQPLIYLFQVPFSSEGFGLFRYYKYWFIWTLFTLPMGFIGYYIKKNNIVSVIILLPMILLLAYLGLGYLSSTIENFPHHLLSCISCFALIIIIPYYLFDKWKLRIIPIILAILFCIFYLFMNGGVNSEYETYKVLDNYNITFVGEANITFFSGTKKGDVSLIKREDNKYTVKINGRMKGKYKFDITDESNHEYHFEYSYNEETKSVELNYLGE